MITIKKIGFGYLVENCLVWADETPFEHFLLAVWVGHGVAHMEQLEHSSVQDNKPASSVNIGETLHFN